MQVKIDSLISLDELRTNLDQVFSVVDKNGKALLIKDNKPTYILIKYEENSSMSPDIGMRETPKYTLHEAMKIVLSEAENRTMHASELADEI